MKNVFSVVIAFFFVFAFEDLALADQMYGVLMVVKGSVKVQNANKQTSDAKVGGKVYEGETLITGADSRAKVVMSDRNVINVNPNTQITIAAYKNDSATGEKNVELNLLQGKVRTNVEQTYDGGKNKFLIKTPTAVAGVRGTQFLAGFDPATRMTSIVTFKGSVTLASVGANGKVIGSPVLVKKGEMTTASPNLVPEAPKAVPKEDLKKMDGDSKGAKELHEPKESIDAADAKEQKEKKREAASETPPAKEPAMVDSRDMDTAIAKEVIIPSTTPQSTPTPKSAPAVTPTPTLIRPIKSNVNIRPVIQN